MNETKMWQPLWGNYQPKPVDRDELLAIESVREACDLSPNEINTVLDIKGRKYLRVKIFKNLESGILLYDYLFFGPLVFANKNICVAEQDEYGVTSKNKDMVKLLDKNQLVTQIKKQIKMKKRANLSLAS